MFSFRTRLVHVILGEKEEMEGKWEEGKEG